MRILVIEDEARMGELLREGLTEEGHTVTVALDGREGLEMAEGWEFDLIILDVMLPGMDGFAIARRLRAQHNQTPILMLTARDSAKDLIEGLDLGADDYLTKPFSLKVLFARIRALGRRGPIPQPVSMQIGDLTLNPGTREVRRGRRTIVLTPREFSLLETLMRNARQVVSRDTLIDTVWGGDSDIESNTLDAFVRLIRAKIEAPGEAKLLRTIRGVGYSLRVELQSVLDALDSDDQPELEDDLSDFAKQTGDNSLLEIRDSEGALIFSSANHAGLSLPGPDDPSWRVLRSRMMNAGKPYDVLLAVPLTDVRVIMRDFRNLLLLMIPLVLMIASGGGYWISRRALTPVDEITRVAKSITVQNLSRRLVVPDTSGELQRMSEAWNDVLQRLDTAIQRIRRFTADASHELRTPVALIRATAELALRFEREPEYYRASLSTIESEATRMTDLTESLLVLARTDSNSVEMPLGPVDLNRIITEVAALSRPAAETRGLTLNAMLAGWPATALANEAGIRRLLFILLDNAFKHTPSGGTVTLSTKLAEGKVTISVCDSGEGISSEDLPHIFERFYRADRSRSSNGAGLGLSIAQMIADLHGSKIEVESTVGSGSCFCLSLNLQTQPVE